MFSSQQLHEFHFTHVSLPQLAMVRAFVLKLVVATSIIASVSLTVAHRDLSDAMCGPDEYVERIKKDVDANRIDLTRNPIVLPPLL